MRQFYLYSESWYKDYGVTLGEGETDDIFMSDDTYDGELRIVWKDTGQEKPVFQITIFQDSLDQLMWNLDIILALRTLPEFTTPKQVCELLKSLGYIDSTRREPAFKIWKTYA